MTEPTVSVETSLALLNQKLDQVLDAHAADGTRRDMVSADHESRIRGLERFQWKREGVSGGLGLIAGTVAAVVIKALGS